MTSQEIPHQSRTRQRGIGWRVLVLAISLY